MTRTARGLAVVRLEMTARKLHAEHVRQTERAEQAAAAAATAQADLVAIWKHECERFGREVPSDAFVLDVLACIDIEPGDVWRWCGPTNNHGVPTIRIPASVNGGKFPGENTAARFLGIAFGIIQPDEFGMLYPLPEYDTDDVNPEHRVLRRSEKPTGNRARYSFTPDASS